MVPLLLKGINSEQGTDVKLSVINSATNALDKTMLIENLVIVIYIMVLFILLYRFVKNIYSLIMLSKSGARGTFSGEKIVLLEDNCSPYSFMKTIFIGRKDYESGTISQSLINHELAHVRQLHSADIVFAEIISAFFWFNPVIYLYKRAVKLNHEYLADSFVINSGYSADNYSDMLLNFSSRGKYMSIISGINYSFLKKRITMIIKINNPGYLKLRLFTAAIISAALFLLTACTMDINNNRVPDPIITMTANNTSGYRLNDSLIYYYGDFSILSGTSKTRIKAHRLKVSHGMSPYKNYFENDFMSGRVYSDGVDINTNSLFLDKVISYKAEKIEKTDNPKTIRLIGQAELKGEDVVITSDIITLYLNTWKH